jgi:hypothetical protein
MEATKVKKVKTTGSITITIFEHRYYALTFDSGLLFTKIHEMKQISVGCVIFMSIFVCRNRSAK